MSCFTFPHKSMVRQPFCLLPHMDKFIVRTKVTKPPRPLPLLASGALQLRKNFDSLVPIPKVHPKFLPQKTSSPKYSEAIAAFCHFKRKVGEHENLRSWQMEFQLMWNEGKADLPALLQQFEKSAREKFRHFLTPRRICCDVNMRVCFKSCRFWLHVTTWTFGGG